ncbi:MAG: FtsQ-type POTRA domain-containing protein [Spirochaetes bacterium]|nr:FtsQ-type POTRA domain-containing protein [Spirochaetota bacterium]
MSSEYLYASNAAFADSDSAAASKNSGKKAKSSIKIEKNLKRFIIIAAVIFAAELVWLIGVTPFVPFSTVEVQEIAGMNRREILSFANLNENSSFFSTSTKDVQKKLAECLLVESATVIKRFPDKMSIFITPRQAVAVALANNASRQTLLFVDRYGVFFRTGDDLQGAGLPILSGFDNPQLGMRLPAGLVPLVESIYELSRSSPELLSAISEIRIERKIWEGFDIVLYPIHSSIRVRLENTLTEDRLRYMLLVLDIFKNSSEKPAEIDLRSGMGSYKVKEQS